MNNYGHKKVKRQTIPLETKILILSRLADGEGSTAVANEFKLGESTIRAIHKRGYKIYESLNSATKDSSKRASYSRNIVIEKTEKALVLWIRNLTEKRIPVHKELIQEKARKYFNQLKDLEPSSSSCLRNVKFSASNGWFSGFLQRYSLHNVKIQGEAHNIIGEGFNTFGENDLGEMIEDQTVNNSDIINNLIDYENGQVEPESITADKIYAGIQIAKKLETHFLKIDTNTERSLKFQKELRLCMSRYCDVYKQLTDLPSSQKLITDFMVPKNESIEILSSSDESDFRPIRQKMKRVLD